MHLITTNRLSNSKFRGNLYVPLLETNNQDKQQRDFYLQSEDNWSNGKTDLGILFFERWFKRDTETVFSLFSQPMQAIMLDQNKIMQRLQTSIKIVPLIL